MGIDWSPLFLSLKIAIVAGVIIFILGILAARLSIGLKGHLKWILDVLFTLPLVMPPTVVGFILLLLFGKNGWIGKWLMRFNVSIIFRLQQQSFQQLLWLFH